MNEKKFGVELFEELIQPISASNERKNLFEQIEHNYQDKKQEKNEKISPYADQNKKLENQRQKKQIQNKYQAQQQIFLTRQATDCSSTAIHQFFTKPNKLKLKVLCEEDTFSCQNCIESQQPKMDCLVCRGEKKITKNSSMIKFLEYLMQFKLHKKQAYRPADDKPKVFQNSFGMSIRVKRTDYKNQFDAYSSTYVEKNKSIKSSGRASMMDKTKNVVHKNTCLSFNQFKQKLQSNSGTHNLFNCDICEANPICGSRYHCEDARCNNDYDLCKQCYLENGHLHPMVQIDAKNSSTQKIYENILLQSTKYSSQYQKKKDMSKNKNSKSKNSKNKNSKNKNSKNRNSKNKNSQKTNQKNTLNLLQVPGQSSKICVSSIH